MDLIFENGKPTDVDELSKLYDDLNDYLEKNVNYPGWRKGIYPIHQHAEDGIKNGTLFVARDNGKIAGSVVLNHEAEEVYHKAKWHFESDYSDVIVIHTLVVHPDYLKHGVGRALMDFAIAHSIQKNAKSIRLDVYEENTPAIRLYEKLGFEYVDKVDLGLRQYGLDWFKLYEKVL